MLSLTDGFSGISRIDAQHFTTALAMLAAADVVAEDRGGGYYRAITAVAVDPLFVLAIFHHESNMGTRGIATMTHSWGNMRNPPVGPVPYHLYHDPAKGAYLSFANWWDGCAATANHLASSLYAGLTIGQAIAKWAPAGDGTNDPAAYAACVVAFMNAWSDLEVHPVATPTEADIGFPVTVNLTGTRGPQRALRSVEWFVVHDGEGGYDSVVNILANNPNASAHAVIAHDGRLTYMVPIEYAAWHAGNLPVNTAAIGVEQEGYVDARDGGYTPAQYASMAAFFRWCVGQGTAIPATYIGHDDKDAGPLPDDPGILGHMDVPDGSGGWGGVDHHSDPGPSYDFNKLVALIGQATPQPAPDVWEQPGNPYSDVPIKAPIWNRWNALEQMRAGLGLAMMGWAMAPEILWQGRRLQRFERGWYGVNDAAGDPWNVVALFPEEWPK